MADRVVENSSTEVPEIPEILDKVLVFTLEDSKEKLLQGADLVPFTALVVKENLFLESHPGDTTEQCFNAARHTVEHARGAEAYAFCYDGYIEIDDGVQDAIIAEGGIPGADHGIAAAYLYEQDDDGNYTFEAEPAYVGEAPNFMIDLSSAESYSDEEIDERYLDDEPLDEDEPTADADE